MADRTPVKAVLSGGSAVGLAEFASGDTIPASALSDAVTQAIGDSTNKIATTAFVANTVQLGSWLTTTLPVAGATGTLTSATAVMYYRKVGRTVNVTIRIDIVTNGTAANGIRVMLPWAAKQPVVFAGRDNLTGSMLQGIVAGGADALTIFTYSNAHPGGDGRILFVSGTYEATT